MAQWNKNNQDYLNQERTLFEVYMCADRYGNIDGCHGTATANSAFGENVAVPITPVLQLDGLYGLNSERFELYTSGTGITTCNTLMTVKTGIGSSGYAVIRSKRAVRYRPGQGALARFTAMFDEGRTGYTQRAGFFTQEQALQVGFNTDGQFGILRENGGKAHIHKFHVTSAATGTENITVTLAGVAKTISIPSGSTTQNTTGIGTATFPGWVVDYNDSDVIFLSESVGPKTGTFSIASSGTLVATSTTAQTGVNHTSNWIYQNDWNFDTLTGIGGSTNPSGVTLNPQKLNVFQINFRWLGVGQIRFAMENPNTGDMMPIHQIHYTNQNTDVHLDNPSLKIGYVAAEMTGNSGIGVTVSGASMMGAIEGIINTTTFPVAVSRSKSGSMNTTNIIYHLLTLRGNLITNNKINTRELLVKRITGGTTASATTPCFLYLYINPTYSTSKLDFTPVGNSASYSTSDAIITGGTPIAMFNITSGAPDTFDLDNLRIALSPQTKFAIGVSADAVMQSADCAITFIED